MASLIIFCYKWFTINCLLYIFSACALESIPYRALTIFTPDLIPSFSNIFNHETISNIQINEKILGIDPFSLKIITFFLIPVFYSFTFKCIFYLIPSQSDASFIMALRLFSNHERTLSSTSTVLTQLSSYSMPTVLHITASLSTHLYFLVLSLPLLA